MLSRFFTSRTQKLRAHQLYQQLVQQARSTAFYQEPYNVPDTMEGRFELILLHLYLVESRLNEIEGQETLRRILQETLINDMDRTLRELGVGDMSLGKEMKKIGAALLGRLQAYRDAMKAKASEIELAKVFARNLPLDDKACEWLSTYVVASKVALTAQENILDKNTKLNFSAVESATVEG